MRKIVALGVLAAGTVLIPGGPARGQGSTTTSTTSMVTSTTVDISPYDDDWYRAYSCWLVAKYGDTWNLDSSSDCDGPGSATTTSATVAVVSHVVVSLLTSTSARVAANANSWVTFNWTVVGGNADLFRVTATADKGVSAAYPGNTPSYMTLHGGDHLANLELDSSAMKLTVPAGVTGNVTVSLHLSYQSDLRDEVRDYTLTVPVDGS
jgi:hypothetical protein